MNQVISNQPTASVGCVARRSLCAALFAILLLGTLPAVTHASGWTGALKGGGQVKVDPITNRATVTRDGVQSQLWDGVHRLQDGSYIIVNSGQVIPNKEILDARRQPQEAEIEGWEGSLIKGYSPCERLVHRVCGFTLACIGQPACDPALQLLEMENEERAAGPNPNLMTYTSDQCRQADTDSGFFTSCPQRQGDSVPQASQP
jgi:hypothetical protein